MGSHPVTLRILVWAAIFCAAGSLSCRHKPLEPTEANKPQPDTTNQMSESSEDQYVLVPVKCVVYHSGYKSIIVAPRVSKPTQGTVVSLECNGKKVEISNNEIVDGYIETKEFGKIGVRFSSMVITVGAGDFTSVREGSSVPEQAIEVYVEKSKQKEFMDLFSKSVETDPNSIAVTVNGVNITEGEIDKLINLQLAGMAAQTPKRSPEFIEQYKKILKQQTLEMMIVGLLLDKKVKEANIVVTEEDVLNRLKEVASSQKPALSLEDFKKKMDEYGQNFDEVKEQVRKGLAYQKLLETQPGGKISVTEDDAKNYYSENQKRFESPEQVRASHILITPDPNAPDPNQAKAKAKAKIQGLLEQIKSGADFAQLAKKHSVDPGTAANGGELPFFSRGQMEPSFEKVAFETEPNKVSGIVETSYGYHIIKVTDRKAASVIPFEQVKDQLINQLKQRKQSEFAQQYVQSLRASAKIVYPPGKEPKSDRPPFPGPPERK